MSTYFARGAELNIWRPKAGRKVQTHQKNQNVETGTEIVRQGSHLHWRYTPQNTHPEYAAFLNLCYSRYCKKGSRIQHRGSQTPFLY